jgi:hypothetical protein
MSADEIDPLGDERIPEPEHGRMPTVLKTAWVIGFAFFLASVIYAFWRY